MTKSCAIVGIVLAVGILLGVVVAVIVVRQLNRPPVEVQQGAITLPPQRQGLPEPEPVLPPPAVPSEPIGGPEWEYVAELLDPNGGFSERTVDYQGDRRANSLSAGRTSSERTFFWTLADLPATYAELRPRRLEGVLAVDDSSDPNSGYQFELRLNNGAPSVFDVRPNSPAEVSVSMDEVYRVDVSVARVGEGYGTPIFVEPKFIFR